MLAANNIQFDWHFRWGASQICAGVGASRCLVLRFRKANILLDCAVPLDSALYAAAGAGEGSAGGDADTAVLGGSPGPHPQSPTTGPAGSGLLDLTPFLPVS